MPLLNYTTKVDVHTTLGAIQGQLVKHGARKIMQDYDDAGHITSLSFMIETPLGMRGVRLPANVDAVHKVLARQKVKCDRDQAERVAWRIVKDWVEAQMAILESEMVQMDRVPGVQWEPAYARWENRVVSQNRHGNLGVIPKYT